MRQSLGHPSLKCYANSVIFGNTAIAYRNNISPAAWFPGQGPNPTASTAGSRHAALRRRRFVI
jgi:hypothetical protein